MNDSITFIQDSKTICQVEDFYGVQVNASL